MLGGIYTQNVGGFHHGPALFVQRQGYTQPLSIMNVTSKKAFETDQQKGSGVEDDGKYGPSKPGFQGEKHVYMKTTGGIQKTNFAGPGTNLKERLKRGDKPINEVDRIAKAHDLRYGLSKNYDDVRRADEKMIASLKAMSDEPLNRAATQAVMQGKLLLEDMGVKRGTFAQHGKDHTPETTALYQSELAPLEQGGLGMHGLGKFKKGSAEAKAHMAALRAKRSKGASKRTKGGLLFTRQQFKKLTGGALSLPGGGKKINITGGALRLPGGALKLPGDGAPRRLYGGIFPFIPILAGMALKALASYGVKKGAQALHEKITGKGIHGEGMPGKVEIDALKTLFEEKVSGPLKAKALSILEEIKKDPMGNIEAGVSKLMPVIIEIAKSMADQEGGGFQELPPEEQPDRESFIAMVLKMFGKEIAQLFKNLFKSKPPSERPLTEDEMMVF